MVHQFLECCCQCAADARQAELSGASRIELCEDLAADGLTPSEENIRDTLAAVDIPVNVLIRCRAGSFVYTDNEVEAMARSVSLCRDLCVSLPDGRERRVNAIVIGALTPEGDVDEPAIRRLLDAWDASRPVTFHRAFDVCRDPLDASRRIASLGIQRILTSGHAADAMSGRPLLAELVQQGSPLILVGGGVRPHNIDTLATDTHATEFHSACRQW